MSWYSPWSESIKKRACRYLLQRYIGSYLEEKLTLEQLSVDLYNGTGTVLDVSLDCQALNELGESMNWPFEIVDGHVKEISVNIPWSTIFKDDSVVEINGLALTVQPKVRAEPVATMLESMWSSMTSSMQLAAECLQDETTPQNTNPLEGIELFAHAIDSILNRIKIKFVNTNIRFQHVSETSDRGVALEIRLKNIDYFDETDVADEKSSDTEEKDEKAEETSKTYTNKTHLKKKLRITGVTFHVQEFSTKENAVASTSIKLEKSISMQNYQSTMSDIFYEATSDVILTDSYEGSTPNERQPPNDPILFAKLLGQQEIYLNIKHSDEVEGVKINAKTILGSLVIFFTPNQLNTLLELADALNQPLAEGTGKDSKFNKQSKQMKEKDYQFVEAELMKNLNRQHSAAPGAFGWSGPSFEENDDEFHPMTSKDEMSKSLTSSVSSMNTSMTSSINMPSSQPRVTKNKKVPSLDGDPSAEVSHINIKIASLSCVLLHKNIVVPMPIGTPYISTASVLKLQEMSLEFFNRIEALGMIGESSDIKGFNDALDKGTDRDHLRIVGMEVSLDGNEKITSRGIKTSIDASVKRMLVTECLYNQREDPKDSTPQKFDLIRFDHPGNESAASAAKPDITLSFKQTAKYMRISGDKQPAHPTTDVMVQCSPCYIDVDLTLVERMSALFFGPSTAATPTATPTTTQTKNQTNITIQNPNLNVILRFPVVGLRSDVSPSTRRVRPDWLELRFDNAALTTQQPAAAPPAKSSTYSIKATNLDLYYHENENLPPTHVAQSCMDVGSMEENILSGNTMQPVPMISLTMKPRTPSDIFFTPLQETDCEPTVSNPMTTSVYMMNNLRSSRPGPFSGKKMVHQSLLKDENDKKEEEIIVPGNENEMTTFTQDSVLHSAVHLDFNLPLLSLQIESKHLYEIIYNRINSDLLLWEPRLEDEYNISPHMPMNPAFGPCKGMGYDSDTESTASDDDKLFMSSHDSKFRKVNRKLSEKESDTHNFCLTLKVGKGLMTIFAPVRDSNKLVVPGQMGELVLNAGKLSLCHVSGLNGRPKTARLCLRAAKTILFHEPTLTIPSEKPKLRLYGSTLPSYLKTTIYPSSKGVIIKDNITEKDMFTMALRTDPKLETSNAKTICIALSIEQATLRYRGDKGIAWLTQFIDVLDVLDYPVPGYTPCAVFSELHAHVADCAVDYRPLYLPIRSVLTIGNFSYSSNIIPETNASLLRFLAQECTLFLARRPEAKCNTRALHEDKKSPNIHKDYVCVVDVGLFELAVRTEDKNNPSKQQPQMEMTASNNMVNMSTCWDSASALCRLLTYVAGNGDSLPPMDRSRQTSICSDHGVETLIGLDDRPVEEVVELSASEMQQVNTLMEEAMKESPNSTLEEDDLNSSTEKEGVEVFFFPDEEKVKKKKRSSSLSIEPGLKSTECDDYFTKNKLDHFNVSKDLGASTSTPRKTKRSKKKKSTKEDKNTDDEYCIVEEQLYSEDDELAAPIVKWIKESYIIDDYFAAKEAKADVLQAPKSFPVPNTRYILRELSLTWNLFGGNDFQETHDTSKKTVSIDDARKRGSPAFDRRSKELESYELSRAATTSYRSGEVVYSAGSERVRPQSNARRDVRTRGGPQRDHRNYVCLCLGKVKIQHELYPQGSKYKSRQTLAIAMVEVLDRVLGSNINKLLSRNIHKDEPERKNAHMLVAKAVQPRVTTKECCAKMSLLPLWVNLDQDTVAFIRDFLNKLGADDMSDDETKSLSGLSTETASSRQTTPTHRPPVMSLGSGLREPPPTPTSIGDADCLSLNESVMADDIHPIMENYEAERLVSDNLIQLEEDFQRFGVDQEKPPPKVPDSEPTDDSPMYFRRIVFSPQVSIRLDYVAKRIDVKQGTVTSLIMGLGTLQYSEITLKRIDYRYGLLGYEKLIQYCLSEWLSDIKRNQLPGLLSGLGPMHAVLQIITGICDLVWLPVEQWRRDGRLVHGLRRGAASFTARTAVAALDITTRLLGLIQATAETACEMLTPSPTLLALRERRPRRRRDSRPPADIREGVNSAYNTVREGIADTAATMAVAARGGSGGGVLRHLPGAAVAPLALAAAGAADLLGGVRAHLAPHAARDHAHKWRSPPPDAVD